MFVITESVIKLFDIMQVFRQGFGKLVDFISGVRSMLRDRAFRSGPYAGPDLLFADSWTDEENVFVFRMRGREHCHAVGFVQPRQVIKIGVLTELEIGVLVASDLVGA